MNKVQFPSAPLRYRTRRQKLIDKKWDSGLLLSEKAIGLGKASYPHFVVRPDGASYEAKEAALKALGRW